MHLRLAEEKDLSALKTMYAEIANHLLENKIYIYWSDYYPFADFEENDINHKTLYVLETDKTIVGAFCLTTTHENAEQILWKHQIENANYISKLGVNVHYLKQGIGSSLIAHAKTLAKQNGAEVLRLFVVDKNLPAIRLYEKCGFKNTGDSIQEYLDFYDVTLTEFAFELHL